MICSASFMAALLHPARLATRFTSGSCESGDAPLLGVNPPVSNSAVGGAPSSGLGVPR
jgi:hypothetical protein